MNLKKLLSEWPSSMPVAVLGRWKSMVFIIYIILITSMMMQNTQTLYEKYFVGSTFFRTFVKLN